MEYLQRFKTNNMDINCQIKFVSSAIVRNMSIGGVSMKTNFSLNIDNIYRLEVENDNHSLKLQATTVWSNVVLIKEGGNLHDDFIPLYTLGMKFSDVSKDKLNEIVNFVEKYQQKADNRVDLSKLSHSRHNIRTDINESKKCFLNFSVNCKILELGLGSMLIKSGHELETRSPVLAMITSVEGEPIKTLGRVVSYSFMGRSDTEQVFDIGIEFTEVSDEDSQRIKKLISSTIVSDSVKKLRTGTI